MKGFRDFILRGNMVDLAVGIVIGAAFTTVVSELVKDLITPLIAAIGGQPNFGSLYFTVNKSKFMYGNFVNALISFLIVAAVVYFLVVMPINKLMTRFFPKRDVLGAPKRDCPECLTLIPAAASRCASCGIQVEPELSKSKRKAEAQPEVIRTEGK